MIFNIGSYTLDVDVEATKCGYAQVPAENCGCGCSGCRNFLQAAAQMPEKARTLLTTMGVDPAKFVHISPMCALEGGAKLDYLGWYHLCGHIVKGMQGLVDDQLCDGFSFSFTNQCQMADVDFPRPLIQMDFYAVLPWVLEEENTY